MCCRCAIDQEPRKLSTQQLSILANLAEMVVRRIERDKQILLQQHSKTALLRTLRNQQEAVFMCDTAMSGWPVLFTNKSCQDMLDWDEGTLGGRGVWDVFKIDPGRRVAVLSCIVSRCKMYLCAWPSVGMPWHQQGSLSSASVLQSAFTLETECHV